jgi:hypothetical protein
MTGGGTKIFCPECQGIRVCRALSPTVLDQPSSRRVQDERYPDLNWFRRGRECLACAHKFLTGELDEDFIRELVELRRSWLRGVSKSAQSAARAAAKRERDETVPVEDARAFIRATAKWDHPSYSIVDAPKHANRIYKHALGWAIDFGANTFLPGMAVARSFREMSRIFSELADGKVVFREQAIERLIRTISGCVATHDGYEYNGYYPLDGYYLTFGTQLIDADDGARLILEWADPNGLLLSRQ